MTSLWTRVIGPAQRHFRHQRARRILEHCPQIKGAVVIDVGGSLRFWREMDPILRPKSVICYNISQNRMLMSVADDNERIRAKLYDGERIPEADGAADVVICNSVIEHVPPAARRNLAAEIKRVGKAYVVQTPSPAFPLELHFGLPFIHWLPRRLGRVLVRFSPFHLLSGADGPKYFDETRLLGRAELLGLFPSARLVVERTMLIPKSYLLFGQNIAAGSER